MKKFISLAAILATVITAPAQNVPDGSTAGPSVPTLMRPLPADFTPPGGQLNFTRTYQPYQRTTNAGAAMFSLAPGDRNCKLVTAYTDGWGKPIETISRGGPGTADLLQEYDNRPSLTSYGDLPLPVGVSSYFQVSPFGAQQWYYSSTVLEGGRSYSKTVTSYPAGVPTVKSFKPGRYYEGADIGSTVTTTHNTAADGIIMYKFNLVTGMVINFGAYPANTLTVETTTTPHDGKTVEFKDRDGRVVCKQVYATSTAVLTTYYVYNDYGVLSRVITPKASEVLATTPSADVSELVFTSRYTPAGLPHTKLTPGKIGPEKIIYNRRQQAVLAQTPLLAAAGKYKFTIYDSRGRAAISGLTTESGFSVQQGILDAGTAPAYGSLLHYLQYGITGPYPTSLTDCEILQVNYYDKYVITRPFSTAFSSYYLTGGDLDVPQPYNVTQGLLTTSLTRVSDGGSGPASDLWISSVYYYDQKARLIQVQSLNSTTAQPYATCMSGAPAVPWDVVTNQYFFNGFKRMDVVKIHNATPGADKAATVIRTRYQADAENGMRPVSVFQSIDDGTDVLVANYQYDNMGRVKQKNLGTVESQKYEYTTLGQLKSINKDYVNDPCGSPGTYSSFGVELFYNFGFSVPRYDGSISGIIWRGASHVVPKRAYGYEYDRAGRLKHAEFRQYNLGTAKDDPCGPPVPGRSWNKEKADFTVSNVTYDANGNLLTMRQRGTTPTGPVMMDDLAYGYKARSNELQLMVDAIPTDFGSLGDFFDVVTACPPDPLLPGGPSSLCPEYAYDGDGNLTADGNKHITSITYNEMDQPLQVTYASGTNIKNTYDAAGTLLLKEVNTIGPVVTHKEYRYLGPLTYENNELQFALHPEGRARFNAATGYFTYDFFVKDHLGNVRTVVTKNATNAPVAPGSAGTVSYMATHEIASAGTESLFFSCIDDVRDYRPLGTPSNVQAARLNGGEAGRQIGTSILLKVMAGDQFDLSCQAYWSSDSLGTTTADSTMLSSLISTLTAAQANMPNPEGNVVQLVSNVFSPANYAAYQSVVNDVTDPAAPRAYLNYVMFDEQMNLVPGQSGAIQVSSIGGSWHVIGTPTPISVTSSGYFGVYLSDASSLDVFFDGLHINVYQGNLLQEQHYYPFGLTFAMAESGTAVPNRYKYQGKELMSEAKLNLYDFTARQYDPQIGRFWGIDPLDQFPSGYTGMGNDPANNIDPTGMWTRANPGNPINPSDGGPAKYSSQAYGFTTDTWNEELNKLKYISALEEAIWQWERKQEQLGGQGQSLIEYTGGMMFGSSGYWRKRTYRYLNCEYGDEESIRLIVGTGIANHWVDLTKYRETYSGLLTNAFEKVYVSLPLGELPPPKTYQGAPSLNFGFSSIAAGGQLLGALFGRYSVYRGLDAMGTVRYIGMTSREPFVRFAEHFAGNSAKSMLEYEVIEGATGLTRFQARVWEQTLINQYGLEKNGGTLVNEINSIAPKWWSLIGIKQ